MTGGILVIVGIIVIVMIHETGHFLAARAVGMKATEFFFGFGPRLWSTRRGDTEYGVKLLPLGGYVRIVGMSPLEEIAPEDEGRTYKDKPFWAKSLVVLAGSATHFPVAFLLFYLAVVGWGLPQLTTTLSEIVPTLADGSATPAAQAGLLPGDQLVSVAGVPITEWADLQDALATRAGETVTLSYDREGQQHTVEVRLAAADDGAGGQRGYLGVSPTAVRERAGPVAGLGSAGRLLGETVVLSGQGLWRLVSGVPDVLGAVFGGNVDDLGYDRPLSAVGLVKIAGGQSAGDSLTLVASVAVFVGVLNAIPLYPLDGGHFAVALYEKLRGRRADVRKLMPVAAVVVGFLILIGLLALYLDILHPIKLG